MPNETNQFGEKKTINVKAKSSLAFSTAVVGYISCADAACLAHRE
jgi:hypothetical protein